jgi:signal transduction histidine kinase
LTIDDDGIADPNNFQGEGGLGLLGIHERVRALGGQLLVLAKSGGGLHTEITLPYPHQEENALHGH